LFTFTPGVAPICLLIGPPTFGPRVRPLFGRVFPFFPNYLDCSCPSFFTLCFPSILVDEFFPPPPLMLPAIICQARLSYPSLLPVSPCGRFHPAAPDLSFSWVHVHDLPFFFFLFSGSSRPSISLLSLLALLTRTPPPSPQSGAFGPTGPPFP